MWLFIMQRDTAGTSSVQGDEAQRHREYQSKTPSLCISVAQNGFSDAPTITMQEVY